MRTTRITAKQTVALVEADVPDPAEGEALLRIIACGICGSDLHAYLGQWKGDRPGHEFCAVVEAVGPDADPLTACGRSQNPVACHKPPAWECDMRVAQAPSPVESPAGAAGPHLCHRLLRPGLRVTGECFAHCGRCAPCARGEYNHCEALGWFPGRPGGALSERMVYPVSSLYAVPDALTDRQAMLVEPLAVAFRAVARGAVAQGEVVAVIGAGTIGLLCAAVARARGAARVVSIARHAHQARMAAELGATDVALPDRADPREVVRGASGGRGADVAIDAVATGTSLSTALAIARPHGRVVEAGGATRPVLLPLNPLVDSEVTILGSGCYAVTDGRRDFLWAMDLIAGGRIPIAKIVTHTFPLGDVAEAFRTAADKRTGAIKVAVVME